MSNKNKQTKHTRAEHAVANFFLQERGRYVSFKQLKKKFSDRFNKHELYEVVHNLAETKFLEQRGNQFRYAPDEAEITEEHSGDSLMEGIVDMISSGHAYVISPESDQDIWIDRRNLNTAMEGDKVKVLLIKRKRKKPEGRVIEVVQRSQEILIGTIQQSGDRFFFTADKKGIDIDFMIPRDKSGKAKGGEKVAVKLISWEPGTRYPVGEVIRVLGKAGANETEMQSILLEYGFRLEFSKQVLKESEKISDEISGEEIQRRKDFREVLTFTIDPEDAKDFDDAISYRTLDDEWYEVGVHIADVTAFIPPGSELDKEALQRATSVYLVDRCVPMLPEKLSNGLCSLTPENDKLTFSAVFVMNADGEIKSEWFGKTVIHSKRRFSYEEAQEIIDGKKDPFSEPLERLNAIAKKLRYKRFKNGAINFDTVEVKFRLDPAAKPVEVFVKQRKDANLLIEDFMLLANRKVAEFIGKSKGRQIPFVYRVHDLPDDEKLKNFAELAHHFGYKLNFSTPGHTAQSFNKMIDRLKGKPEQYMLETLAIRTMAKAVYSSKNIGHYGLAFSHYTHFTSPIRRYPDMMAHRILEKVLNGEKVHEPSLEVRCDHCSEMERKAAEAERTSVKLKQVEFMENRIGEIFDGIISGVTEWGMFVITEDSYCEGLVRLDSIGDDFYEYDQKKHMVRGIKKGKKFQLGDKVRVKLTATNLAKRTIDFVLED